jgi:hypothetical protein
MLGIPVLAGHFMPRHRYKPDLGEGWGQVYEGVRNIKGARGSLSKELTKEEKKRRVVLKRVNNDNLGMRSDFLRTGTMAQVRGLPPLPPVHFIPVPIPIICYIDYILYIIFCFYSQFFPVLVLVLFSNFQFPFPISKFPFPFPLPLPIQFRSVPVSISISIYIFPILASDATKLLS